MTLKLHILLNVFGHNKSYNGFLLAADFLLEFFNSLVSGNSSTDFVKKKIELLFSCEDLPSSFLTNIQNNSKNIGKACIAYLALIIRPEDLDTVVCLFCGCCPKVVNRYGSHRSKINSKGYLEIFYEIEHVLFSVCKYCTISLCEPFLK